MTIALAPAKRVTTDAATVGGNRRLAGSRRRRRCRDLLRRCLRDGIGLGIVARAAEIGFGKRGGRRRLGRRLAD